MRVPPQASACSSPSPADAKSCLRSGSAHKMFVKFAITVDGFQPIFGWILDRFERMIVPPRQQREGNTCTLPSLQQNASMSARNPAETTLQCAKSLSIPCSPLPRISGASEASVVNFLAAVSAGLLSSAIPTCASPVSETAAECEQPVDSAFSGDTDNACGGRTAANSAR